MTRGASRSCVTVLLWSSLACLSAVVDASKPAAAATAVAATEAKVLRFAFRSVETGFDPQRVDDVYSSAVCSEIFESLLEFDHFARPVKLVPGVAEAVPTPEDGGRTYTFRLQPGIYFADDPAFGGKRRELVAADAAYAIKRLRDPRNRAPYSWLFLNNLTGLDELHDEALKTGSFDYDRPIAGIEVVDRYTLRLRLKEPDYTFLYRFALPQTAPVAREVITAYGEDTMSHPVGTGPFRLAEWTRRQKIVLVKNPDYRGRTLDTTFADLSLPQHRQIVAELQGKTLPQLDRVEIYPMDTDQPRFLSFMSGAHDLIQELPVAFIGEAVPAGNLAPALVAAGVRKQQVVDTSVWYTQFNMEHPVVGGYTPERVALRRAITFAFDRGQAIAVLEKGQGLPAYSPIPPGMVGYDPTFITDQQEYDPARAVALLDMYGWVDADGDGWRDQPNGEPFTIDYLGTAAGSTRQYAAMWERSLRRVGIRLDARAVQFSDQLRDRKAGKYMMAAGAWTADWPDGQNFLALLYGPNAPDLNDARFKLPEYDRLYERSLQMPDSPERNLLYREMTRLMLVYAPWRLLTYRNWTYLNYPWVLGYMKHPMYQTRLMYLDVDPAARRRAQAD
jgi:oligopeptide transport system substrate-binding protein